MPETEPTAWELMRVLRDIREDLRDMKKNSITRDEWALSTQATDRRFEEVSARMVEWRDTSTAEHVELHARVDAVVKDVKEVRSEREQDEKEKRKQQSGARLAIAVATFSAVLAFASAILQGVFGA